jgi:hypothetical protein
MRALIELLQQSGEPFAQDGVIIDDEQLHAGIISRNFQRTTSRRTVRLRS